MTGPSPPPEEARIHWSKQKEAAGRWRMFFFLLLIRALPPPLLRLAAYPVGFGYFLFSKKGRTESRRYFRRLESFRGGRGTRRRGQALKHICAFALSLVEKAEAWRGTIPFKNIRFQDDDIAALVADLEEGRGAALICSHLGNAELLRALADSGRTGVSRNVPVTAIVDFEVGPFWSRLLSDVNPRSSLKIISANAIDPGSIIALKEETENGGLAVISGDRTAAGERTETPGADRSARPRASRLTLPFLGVPAAFPAGAFLTAALLEAPVYAVFALRRKDLSPRPEYDMHVRFLGRGDGALSRTERRRMIEGWARNYAAQMENHCLQHPYQWYNFFDFWEA